MRRAGRVVAEMLDRISAAVRPGITTAELDAIGRAVLADRGATSNFLGYHGFPAVICASPNEVIVHGIPGPRVLDEGDIISIDCGAIIDGWHGDAAVTVGVGTIDAESQRLIDTAEAALAAGIAELVDGGRLGNVGEAVQRVGESAGFSVVEEYTGHAIGQAMHESPGRAQLRAAGVGRQAEGRQRLRHRADVLRRQRRDPHPGRQLDRRHARRPPRRPRRALHRHHRTRPRDPHPPVAAPAAGGPTPPGAHLVSVSGC